MLEKNTKYFDEQHYVIYQPLNGKDLGVKTNFIDVYENYFNDEISEVYNEDGEILLGIGDELTIHLPVGGGLYKTKYPIKSILPDHDQKYRYIASVEKNNKTNTYFLPCLSQNYVFFGANSYMINSYISSDLKLLLIRYRFSPSDDYIKLEEELKAHSNYYDYVDIDGFSVMYRFKIPEQFRKDAEYFLEGDYSKLSGTLKNRIKIFHYGNKQIKPGYMDVIHKSDRLRERLEYGLGVSISKEAELESKPDLKQEVWQQKIQQKKGTQRSSPKRTRQL